MSWRDRLREAAYTSPSGSRLAFAYEAVSRETPRRTAAFDFPGVDDAYVQDNGHGAQRYPLRAIFFGDDHDLEAAAFEAALLERGVGRLEHPLYGTVDVIPVGDITRRDDLRESANQTLLEVTFWTSVAAIYPTGQTNLRSEVLASLDALEEAGARQFEDNVDLSTVAAQENTKAATQGLVADISRELGDLAAASSKINAQFRDAQTALNGGLDVLIGQPLQLAQQLSALVTAPARARAGIASRLEGYGALAERIIASPRARPWDAFASGVVLPGRRRSVANDFHTALVVVTSAGAGGILSVLEHTFAARPEALAAAETILAQLDAIVAWMDSGFATLADVDASGGIDTGAAYQALSTAAAVATGYLVDISFTLLPERRVVLDRARTIIDVAAELYGSVDERLDFLIETNGFTGSEILELPRGTSVVYYA